MKISCIAIDDEAIALQLLENYISRVPYLDLKSVFLNPIRCLDYLKENPVDLIFMDIQMDDLNGLQLLELLEHKPSVIVTSGYDKFALRCYELSVDDYLLKPIFFDRFLKAVNKVYDKVINRIYFSNSKNLDYFFVKSETKFQKIFLDDILYIEGMGDYLKIVTKNEKILTLQNLKNLEKLLPSNRFLRVHKSYIVAIDKIYNIEKNTIKINNFKIPISDTYKKQFFNILEQKKLF